MYFKGLVASITTLLAAHQTTARSLASRDAYLTQYDPAVIGALRHATEPPLGDPSFACTALGIAFRAQVTLLSSQRNPSSYQALEQINYAETCWLPAACIVSPQDAGQTARVLQIVGSLQTKFAVRSGGHKDSPGFASIDGSGVLISLGNLTAISLSEDTRSVTVGPGNRWQAVYDYLKPENLTAVGGRVGDVGVGGFLLGGGVGYLTNQYGIGLDNIKTFEVALADGRVLNASALQNSDLYTGLKGGSSNFGIVTAYEINTYKIGVFNFEVRAYALSQTAQVLRALAEYQKSGQQDVLSRVDLSVFPTGTSVLLLYNGAVFRPKAFDAFYDITSFSQELPPVNGSFSDVINLQNLAFSQAHVRTYGETFSHTVDADFMVDAYYIFANLTAKMPANATAVWTPIAMGANVANGSQAKDKSRNVLGLSPVPQQWHEWYLVWDDVADDSAMFALADNITSSVTSLAQKRGVLLPYLFMNTAGGNQSVLQSFGQANVQTIQKVAAKYDPKRVFQSLQNDGYLLRKIQRTS